MTGGIAIQPEEYTKLSEYDERYGGEYGFNTISIKCKTGIISSKKGLQVKAKTASKLYFMNQRQIEKAVLMSLLRKKGATDHVKFEELWLQDIVESYTFPTYRKVFTKLKTASVVILNANNAEKHILEIDMPHFTFKTDNGSSDAPIKFKKYVDPDNYNVMLQSRLQDWKESAIDIFSEMIGDDPSNPVAPHIKSNKNTIIFERNNKD